MTYMYMYFNVLWWRPLITSYGFGLNLLCILYNNCILCSIKYWKLKIEIEGKRNFPVCRSANQSGRDRFSIRTAFSYKSSVWSWGLQWIQWYCNEEHPSWIDGTYLTDSAWIMNISKNLDICVYAINAINYGFWYKEGTTCILLEFKSFEDRFDGSFMRLFLAPSAAITS